MAEVDLSTLCYGQCVCVCLRACVPNNKSLNAQSTCTPVAPESEAPDVTPLGWCPTQKGGSGTQAPA